MRRFTLMLMAVVLASGCKPPPPAPEGLDASSAYLIREFHAADDVFDAGLQGFMEWFDDEGFELVGERATSDTTDAFTVGDLSDTDISYLPVVSGRDIEAAAGIVSLSDMDCEVAQSEALLVRPDQFNVFADDWDAYDRTFFRVVRLHALAYAELRNGHNLEREAKAYLKAMTDEPGFYGVDWLDARYAGELDHAYPLPRDYTMMTGSMAMGFWLRRHVDGTEDVLTQSLGVVLRVYDPTFVQRHPEVMKHFGGTASGVGGTR